MSYPMLVKIQTDDFDVNVEHQRLRQNYPQAGAVVSFLGCVRDLNENQAITAMTLEHYPQMTQKSIEAIIHQAYQRWQLINVTVIHRVGRLAAQDQIVWVGVLSSHRTEGFRACEFIMDYLKTQAPFWKKEETPSGARWVDARETDELALNKWTSQ